MPVTNSVVCSLDEFRKHWEVFSIMPLPFQPKDAPRVGITSKGTPWGVVVICALEPKNKSSNCGFKILKNHPVGLTPIHGQPLIAVARMLLNLANYADVEITRAEFKKLFDYNGFDADPAKLERQHTRKRATRSNT